MANNRWMTRSLIACIVGLLCVALGACGSSNSSSSGTPAGTSKKTSDLHIGFLVPEENQNAYSAAYADNVRTAAEHMGVKVTILDSNYTASVQQSQMKELIAQKVDGIVLWPGIQGTSLPMLLAAKAANIPVNISNSAVADNEAQYYHTYTGTDDEGKGEQQGKLVAKSMGNKGNLIVITGQPGSGPAVNILKGFEKALGEVAPNMKILATQPGDWQQTKAATATANLLSRFGSQVDAVVASDDVMAAGSAQAIKSAGLAGKVKLFGMGYYTMTPALLDSGAETGTLFQSPCWDGVMALRQIVAVVKGEDVPSKTIMPVPAIEKGTQYKPNGCLPGVSP